MQASDFLANLPQALVLLAGNLVLGALVMLMLHRHGRTLRAADEAGGSRAWRACRGGRDGGRMTAIPGRGERA